MSHCSLVLTCTEWLWPSRSPVSKHTFWQVPWSSYEGVLAAQIWGSEDGLLCARALLCFSWSLSGKAEQPHIWSIKEQSLRKPLGSFRGTGHTNYFEAIITKSLPPFFHVLHQQEGRALSSRRYLIPIEVSGNKVLKYLGESGSKNLIAWLHLCERLTAKVCISLARSYVTPSIPNSKLAQVALLSTQFCLVNTMQTVWMKSWSH